MKTKFRFEKRGPHRYGVLLGSAAFSLIEVVIAIGIVSFAVVAIMATVPVGTGVYQDARAANVETQIFQQVNNQLQNAPYSSLFNTNGGSATTNITAFKNTYDVEGRNITAVASAGAPVYTVTLTPTNTLLNGATMNNATSGQTLAQTVQVNLVYQNKTNILSTLIVNKGY